MHGTGVGLFKFMKSLTVCVLLMLDFRMSNRLAPKKNAPVPSSFVLFELTDLFMPGAGNTSFTAGSNPTKYHQAEEALCFRPNTRPLILGASQQMRIPNQRVPTGSF